MKHICTASRPGLVGLEDRRLYSAIKDSIGTSYYAGTRIITASDTIQASDLGKLLVIRATAGATLTLTAPAARAGQAFWCGIRRDDGLIANVTLTYATDQGSGTASLPLMQEHLDIFGNGTGLSLAFENTGLISCGQAQGSGGTTLTITPLPALGNEDGSNIRIELERLTTAAASTFTFTLGGIGYTWSGVQTGSSAVSAFSSTASTVTLMGSAGSSYFAGNWEFENRQWAMEWSANPNFMVKAKTYFAAQGAISFTTSQAITSYVYHVYRNRPRL